MSARLLALDSSTETLAVAVAGDEGDWLRAVPGGALASSRIIGLALEGLAACGLQVADLDAVAFAAGPGAFTGLRCACAVAQGLAFGVAKRCWPSSLMIVAEAARARAAFRGRHLGRDGCAHGRSLRRTLSVEAAHWLVPPHRRWRAARAGGALGGAAACGGW
jgi:tRNA threonylcarbamoyl adenosine modification protein YeaZ